VQIEGTFYLTYTAYDGTNALGTLATSTDLIHWEKKRMIVSKVTYNEFKHFAETKKTISEKYVRFNEYEKSHQKQDRKVFLWDKNLTFPSESKREILFSTSHKTRHANSGGD
jgi:predicted GH43/DUF377 family glycosyl hydrolase